MKRRGDYGALAERVARARTENPLASAPVRHCWVTDSHGRLPGLLLEWCQTEGEWRSRVVHPVQVDGGWVTVEEWLQSGLLDPVVERQ